MCKPWSLVVKDPLWASSASTTATPQAQPPSSAGGSTGGTPENVATEVLSTGGVSLAGSKDPGVDKDVAASVGPTLNEAALAARREKKQALPFGALETPSLRLSDTVSGRVGDILDIEESRRGWKTGSRSQPPPTSFGTNKLTAAAAAISAFNPGGLFLSGGSNGLFKTPVSWAPFPSKKTSQSGGGDGESGSAAESSNKAAAGAPDSQSEAVQEQRSRSNEGIESLEHEEISRKDYESKAVEGDEDSESTKRPSTNEPNTNEANKSFSLNPQQSNLSSRGSSQSIADAATAGAPRDNGSTSNTPANRWLAAGNFLNAPTTNKKSGMPPNRQSSLVHLRGNNRGPPEDLAATYAQAGRYVPPSMRNKARKALEESTPLATETSSSGPAAQGVEHMGSNRSKSDVTDVENFSLRRETSQTRQQHYDHTIMTEHGRDTVGGIFQRSSGQRESVLREPEDDDDDDEVPPPPFSPPPVVSFHSQSATVASTTERRSSREIHSPPPPPNLLKGSPVYDSFEVTMDGWPRWMDAALNNNNNNSSSTTRHERTSSTLPHSNSSAAAGGGGGLADETAASNDWRHHSIQQRMYGAENLKGLYPPQPTRIPYQHPHHPHHHQQHHSESHHRPRLSSSESGGGGNPSAMVLNHVETTAQAAVDSDLLYSSQASAHHSMSHVPLPGAGGVVVDPRSSSSNDHPGLTDVSQLVLPVAQVHPGLTAWASKRVQTPLTLHSSPMTPRAAVAVSASPTASPEYDVETSMHVAANSHQHQPPSPYNPRMADTPGAYNARAEALRYRHFMDSLPPSNSAAQLLQSSAANPSRIPPPASRYFDHQHHTNHHGHHQHQHQHPSANHHPVHPSSHMSHDPVAQATATSRHMGATVDTLGGGRRVSPPSLFFGTPASALQFDRQDCFFPSDGVGGRPPQQQPSSLRTYVDATSTSSAAAAADSLPLHSWNGPPPGDISAAQFHPDIMVARSTWNAAAEGPSDGSAAVGPSNENNGVRQAPRCDDQPPPAAAHSPIRTNMGASQNAAPMHPPQSQSVLNANTTRAVGMGPAKLGEKRYKVNKRGNQSSAMRGGASSSSGIAPRTTLASTAAAIAQLNKTHKAASAVPIGADPAQ